MVFYFVQRGETLYHIARRYQTTVHAIVAANRLEDPNAITPGQALIIPRPGEVPSPPPGGIVHLVRPGETVFHLARRFGTPAAEILRANQIAHPEFILPGQQLVIPELQETAEEWPMAGRTAGRGGNSPVHLVGQPHLSWSCSPRRVAGLLPSAPVIRYDRIYAGLGDGAYYCLEKASGRVKWRWPLAGTQAGGSLPAPAVYDGLVYLGTPDGLAVALDAFRGTPVWKTPAGAGLAAGPAVAGGIVYLGALDGQMVALEAKTGALVWRRELGAPVAQPVAVGDGVAYAVDQAGRLWALDAQSGEPCWPAPAAATPAPPVFAELLVLVGGQAVDPRDGQGLWQVPEQAAPAVRAESLLYPGGAVDLFAGEYRWRTAAPRPDLPVAAAGSQVLAVTPAAELLALAGEDGRPGWRVPLGTPPCHPPAVAPGLVVATLADGSLRAIRLYRSTRPPARDPG